MKKTFSLSIIIVLALALSLAVSAHPGRTDSAGGHTNHSTGEHHFHHGYSAHSHEDIDGDGTPDCPYNFDDQTTYSTGSSYEKTFSTWTYEKLETTKVPTPTPAPTAAPKKTFDPSNNPFFLLGLIAFVFLIMFLPAIISDIRNKR